jgi:ABC-type transport system involved in cytochrome bd biosynthesis fused ATPase/permease subunit
MELVWEKLAVFAPFFLVMLLAVAPAIVSVVDRIKGLFVKVVVPDYVWWLTSMAVAVGVSYVAAYVFSTVDLDVPPTGIVIIIGVLTGLHASGLVDLNKFRAGTKR